MEHYGIYLYHPSLHFLVDRLAGPTPNNTFNSNHILEPQIIYNRMSIRELIWQCGNLKVDNANINSKVYMISLIIVQHCQQLHLKRQFEDRGTSNLILLPKKGPTS